MKPASKYLAQIQRWWKRREKDPDEPYELVGAPNRPRSPLQTLSAKAKLDRVR